RMIKDFFSSLGQKVKNSYFMVNKMYLWILFLVALAFQGAIALLVAVFLFLFYFFTQRVPMEPRGTFTSQTHVYKKTPALNLKLDVWYPNPQKERYPVVFFAHGGGWITGFRNQPNNVSWSRFLAARGIAVVSIDYRYGFTISMEDILTDYSDALQFVRENAAELRLDADNMVLMGLSAGGHLSLLFSAYYTHQQNAQKMAGIQGVVAFYSPSDLKDIFEKDNKSLFARFATVATMKGRPEERDVEYQSFSPIHWVSERMPPVLLAHGKKDTVVPFDSSVKLYRALEKLGVRCEFYVHKKGGHAFPFSKRDFQTVRILEHTVHFLKALFKSHGGR
ncbi:MAG TPA: alpha/beta hydrolase, partial [Thermotogota bacterium]|nr:alpha/beta hydrolase [Thermotogota bacterium]